MRDLRGPIADLFDGSNLRDRSARGWNGQKIEHFRFSGTGDRLEPFYAICSRLWSPRQPHHLQFHVKI